jgi:CDP-glycerol glycerophosphotransferase
MPLARVPGAREAAQRLARRRGPLVVFDSWRGAYSDNPRAISEALHEHRPALPQFWVARDEVAALIPDWADRARPGTAAHLRALGAASHVVTNVEMPGYFRKRPGTQYIQTWHGTPLKRVAFDVADLKFTPTDRYLARFAADVERWDLLLSPNAFSTDVFRRSFRYDGPVLESGYPRNDVLLSPAAESVRASVRHHLGIEGQAVLYAPTWRDSLTFDLQLDPGRLRKDGRVLLLRSHHVARIDIPAEHADWVVDVSDHPDIRELYLAADVLVTDYSSSLFDFAATRKPIILFTYDLEHYRDDLRGLNLDLEAAAPGPVVRTNEALAAALDDLLALSARHARDYDRFTERFCALDDGHAAERVIEAVF